MSRRTRHLLSGVVAAVFVSLNLTPSTQAGGACTPQLAQMEATLAERTDGASKDKAAEYLEAAKQAEGNYDEEGCLKHLKRAMEALDAKAAE